MNTPSVSGFELKESYYQGAKNAVVKAQQLVAERATDLFAPATAPARTVRRKPKAA